MKNNKHPHHDLIAELISETSKKVIMVTDSNSIVDVELFNIVVDTSGSYTFKIKPREFTKGHWYPCIDQDGDNMIYLFNGDLFQMFSRKIKQGSCPSSFVWIGESLGEIKFGGE